MSDILARLQAAHADREMVAVPVPEYDDTWYFRQPTVADHQRIRRGINPKDEHALMVSGLMCMALTKDGQHVFPQDTSPERTAVVGELQKINLAVLQRIIQQSAGGLPASVAAEIGTLDAEAVQLVLADAVQGEAPLLAAAVRDVGPEILQRALRDIAQAADQKVFEKNV